MAGSGESLTFADLDAQSNQTAHLFREKGLAPRDGIALLLDNQIPYLVICWAAQRSGLYFTPISILFQQAEIEYILNNSDAKVLITSQRFLDRFDPTNCPGIEILLVDEGDHPNWQDAIDGKPVTPVTDEAEGAEMVYSSGTTGRPKGVRFELPLHPVGTVTPLVARRIQMHGVDATTRYLSTAPLYHSAPMRYCLMVSRLGGKCIIMEKFDAETALQLIEQHAITHSQWVPTMFNRLLRLPEDVRRACNLASLRFAIHAAAPCPVSVKRQMIDWWGPILYEYYSGTEANGSTAINSDEWLAHPGSVGRSIHGELEILDDNLKRVATGETGTVYFRNGSDFSYYKDPEKTAGAYTPDGASTLGDMGYVDADGYLYLTDRKSFMIISGGVNIYPQEIENVLVTHPKVVDVAVIGVPNEEFGEEVKAVVELAGNEPGSDALASELINLCRDQLSHVKCPRSVDFATLPRHPTGKLYKKQLRDQYWSGHTSRIV